jgi:serine/threonine-protein kinase
MLENWLRREEVATGPRAVGRFERPPIRPLGEARRMTDDLQEVVVCTLLDVQEMRGIAQAALEESVALVSLHVAPPEGPFVLELHAPGSRPVVLLAENAGEPTDGVVPLLLKPFDDEHYGELLAFVCAPEKTMTAQPATRWTLDIPRTDAMPRFDTRPGEPAGDLRVESAGHVSLPPPGPDPLLGRGLAGGKYVIEALLGEGSWGAVYRARHVALDLSLAVKVLHPRFRADASFASRFIAEARAASRLDHPNVARVQDFGEEPDGLLYIVMELLRGTDLRDLLNEHELSRERRMEILASVLRALAAADDHGIVHRDIKPENVVVIEAHNEDGQKIDLVKVCDFGLATVKPRTAGATGATDIRRAAASMSFVAGTPEYMSPEQIIGEDVDIRADLYACGVMLFELLTDRRPFAASSIVDLLRMQLYEPPPSPRGIDPTIDPRLEALVLRALAKERNARPASPREFREELRAALKPRRTADAPSSAPRVGLGDLVASLAGALGRAPSDKRGRAEAEARLARSAELALPGRGAITLSRQHPDDPASWAVLTGGAATRLAATMRERSPTGPEDAETAARLGALLTDRGVVSLSLVEGVTQDELARVVPLLASSDLSADELSAALAEHRPEHVSVLLDADLLGPTRSLPWSVDLCVSRLAGWIGGLGSPRDADAALAAAIRARLVADEVRLLREPDELRRLIDHADLLADVIKQVPELSGSEPMTVVVNAMEPDAARRVAAAYLDDADRSGALAPRALVAVRLLGLRLLHDRGPGAEEVLSRLARRSVLSAAELPPELSGAALAIQTAERLLDDPAGVLTELAGATTLRALGARLRAVLPALPVLLDRDAIAPLAAVAKVLSRIPSRVSSGAASSRSATQQSGAANDEEAPRELAARGLAMLRERAWLARVAGRLLASDDLRELDAARDLLLLAGADGALALVDARVRASCAAGHAGFTEAARAIGAPAIPALVRAIGAATEAPDGGDPVLVEDLLRALPDGALPELLPLSNTLAHHGAASVRRAVVARMPDIQGAAGRLALRVAARDLDESVRVAAFGALRRLGAVDGGVIALARGLLVGGTASVELRIAAAVALDGAPLEHRLEAIEVLREALRPRSRSIIGMLRLTDVGGQDEPRVTETIARALLAIGGEEGRREVERRATGARGELRDRLESLLR